jgi:tRNA pseudouridine32 synthase/23S rRNA pseudouridine746 synthase
LWPDARVVHRLDMATSGLFLMARGLHMQRALGRAFEQREVEKRYEAMISGRFAAAGERGRIELPLAADWPNRPLQKVDHEYGRPSVTDWEVLSYDAGADSTRVALSPLTGRSHQLRVHLRAIGHPILGDPLYAPPEVCARAPRLLLHAAALRLAHPATGEALVLQSAVPF